MEKRERGPRQRLAHRGTIGDASLQITPGGQSTIGPTCPLPASRGKGKAVVEDSDESSSEDDGAFGLSGAKVAQTTRATNVVRSSLPPPLGPVPIEQLVMDDPPTRRERPLGRGAPRPSEGWPTIVTVA
uniref:Uncharacterized protein n=1 Tax=Cannabis sativa TaxID=3483 RepID=A0A803PBV7_CANSA